MKVLFATDGFEPAIQAGRLLEKIADKNRVEVTVMSVTYTGFPDPEHVPLVLDALPFRREDTAAIVDAAVKKLLAAGFATSGHDAEGHPGEEIVRAVDNGDYDLVVMGAGRRSRLGSRVLGSVSTCVLHSAPASVLMVHEGPSGEGRARVLVGVDGSKWADFAVETLAGFIDPTRAEISVVSVVSLPSPMVLPIPGATYASPGLFQEIEEQERARAQQDADHAAARLHDAGFEVEAHITVGSPTEQLLKEAEGSGYDVVAVGARGLGPVRRVLLGSVSDQVARHARAALVGRRPPS